MTKYAKDQPSSFTNCIERVAIVGAGGQIGSHVATALLSTGRHTVTAITRKDSNSKLPDGVKVAHVDYDDEQSLIDALKGQQFLMISLSIQSVSDAQTKIIKAAAKAGVAWVMPNCYATDIRNAQLEEENLTGPRVLPGIDDVVNAGCSSWIMMCCSMWYEFSLSMGLNCYGIDIASKRATFVDDGKTRINTTTWEQCGNAMKGLLSLKELPDDEGDESVTLSQWRNKPLYISSFLVSQRDMLDSVHRVMGTTDTDWSIEYEPHKDRYERGLEGLRQGKSLAFFLTMYTRTFYPNGGGDYETKYGLANEKLGLIKESIDHATKQAINMAEGDFEHQRTLKHYS